MPGFELTKNEIEIVVLIANTGWSNPKIARFLFKSDKTIKCHLSRVFVKLGCESRTEVAIWLWKHGVVSEVDGRKVVGYERRHQARGYDGDASGHRPNEGLEAVRSLWNDAPQGEETRSRMGAVI